MLQRQNFHVQPNNHCVLCNDQVVEDVNCLFFYCPFATVCWQKFNSHGILLWISIPDLSVEDLLWTYPTTLKSSSSRPRSSRTLEMARFLKVTQWAFSFGSLGSRHRSSSNYTGLERNIDPLLYSGLTQFCNRSPNPPPSPLSLSLLCKYLCNL